MLDALDSDLDSAGNKMNVVQASLSKLLNTKDGCQIYLIVVLTLFLIILSKYKCVMFHVLLGTIPVYFKTNINDFIFL